MPTPPSFLLKKPLLVLLAHGMKLSTGLSVLLSLGGCTTLVNQLDGTYWSKQDCHSAHWKALGLEDGTAGLSLEDAQEFYRIRCVDAHQVSVPWARHESGYRAGLERFCTQEGGVRFGFTGEEYGGVCPKGREAAFLAGYRSGLRRYHQKQLHATDRQLVQATAERDKAMVRLLALRRTSANDPKLSTLEREVESHIDKVAELQTARNDHQQAFDGNR